MATAQDAAAALAAADPLALPPIATALARLEQMLTDLARRARPRQLPRKLTTVFAERLPRSHRVMSRASVTGW